MELFFINIKRNSIWWKQKVSTQPHTKLAYMYIVCCKVEITKFYNWLLHLFVFLHFLWMLNTHSISLLLKGNQFKQVQLYINRKIVNYHLSRLSDLCISWFLHCALKSTKRVQKMGWWLFKKGNFNFVQLSFNPYPSWSFQITRISDIRILEPHIIANFNFTFIY